MPLLDRGRLQSTAADAQEEPSEASTVAKEQRTRPKQKAKGKRLQQLDKVPGKENEAGPSEILLDLRKLDGEPHALHERRPKLASRPLGPLGVRTRFVPTQSAAANARIMLEDNKVTLYGTRIPNIWLRDNCQCGSCMHESTRQRLQDTFAIPRDLSIRSASHAKDMEPRNTHVEIEWSDGHKSTYSQPFLASAVAGFDERCNIRQGFVEPTLWTAKIGQSGSPIQSPPWSCSCSRLTRPQRKYGFCYIDHTPHDTPLATEQLLRRIAFIRETHYGGFYDFTADLASQDTAYTNIALEAHTDNTYFSEPAGLQAFHLLSHTDGDGGASLLVDGFQAAAELLRTDRSAYQVLAETRVHAHASGNEGISIQPYRGFPVLEHDAATGGLLRVRWNSADRASIELAVDEVETWYDAARKWDALLKKKENEYWEQLVPGRVLVFDNWRVLHGRSAFTGKRRICGGYINRDDWISRFKMERFGQEKVLGALAGS
ncbi:Trimethyllysine dioxygenase [Didymella exigua CBS 183.55]|uniref:Trimethyllysine dioxygenase n=1 Tax=Didymella exigua CBS 183.55 TaxID=1150837 RepID=A0A6A5S0E5_9PLEO|nr:Trimethyllysine dioxygenase [Didymella exigua CBS 183.55]KAF1932758.1 Trimethyllysine dioxygenase [Didymella exigua CBS 183.55]